MQTQIIDGKKIKDEILINLKKEVDLLPFPPIFCDILIGDDIVSASYVLMKGRVAESIGIKFKTVNFPKDVLMEEVLSEIDNLNRVPHMCGIIVQLPIPKDSSIDTQTILDAIDPSLDVDCLGSFNSKSFYENNINNTSIIGYPTALACMEILMTLNLNLKEKNIVVLGQGRLVGLPLAHLLRSLSLDITVVNSKTGDINSIIKNADIIISAIGQGKFITSDMVKDGVVIIDAGTSEDNGSVIGDVDMESLENKDCFITPTPGGVGPVTVAMLLRNVYKVAEQRTKNNYTL